MVFIVTISPSVIPSNVTNIERCNAHIDTNASAKDMFLSVISVTELLRRDLKRFIVAIVILAKVYVAIPIFSPNNLKLKIKELSNIVSIIVR